MWYSDRRQSAGECSRWRVAALSVVSMLLAVSMAGCIILRQPPEDDPPPDGGGGDGGDPPPPKVVDVLVQVDLRREAGSLTSHYQRILSGLAGELVERNVEVRRFALAPMYRRIDGGGGGNVVPLLYGEGAETTEFGSMQQAMNYYMTDDGAQELRSTSAVDGENLAELGMNLDGRSIQPAQGADPSGRAYFRPPVDGFVVVSMTASARKCSAGSEDCQLNGSSPGAFFTQSSDGVATWLNLPGEEGLAASKIFHAAIATGEGYDSYSAWEDDCTSEPNFPTVELNAMEGSEKRYFKPLHEQIRNNGGKASFLRLCRAMSSNSPSAISSLAGDISSMVGGG